jgi:hypothetical protein
MGEMRNSYKFHWENLKSAEYFGGLVTDGRLIFRRILNV